MADNNNDVTMVSSTEDAPTSASDGFCDGTARKAAAAAAEERTATAANKISTEGAEEAQKAAAAAQGGTETRGEEATAAGGKDGGAPAAGGGGGAAAEKGHDQLGQAAAAAEEEEAEDGMSAHTADSQFSDDDVTMEGGRDEAEDDVSDKSPEERVKLALGCKDHGNEVFRTGALADAKKAYTSGLKYVKDVQLPEAKTLRVALNSNVAMCCLKLEEWQQAIAAADAVLQEEPANVKALYRRGLGRASFGLYSDAKADLLQVLRMEPRNVDARKELERLKEKIAKDNTERRKAYSGLFDRAAGMYADREAQMQRKRQEAAEKEAQLRKEWETEMQTKKEKGEDEIPFEDWKEQKEKAREKEKKRESLAAQHTDSPSGSLGRTKKNGEARKADSLELDEEDKKIIDETKKMGYCYFRRDLTEEERKLNAQHLPTKIDTAAAATPGSDAAAAANGARPNGSSNSAAEEAVKGKQQSGVSSWNAKGTTYEEKDMSQWARQRFEERLLETRVTCGGDADFLKDPSSLLSTLQNISPEKGNLEETMGSLRGLMNQLMTTEVKCTGVKDLTGEAQVVVMRGSKRYLFEFSCTLLLEITGQMRQTADLDLSSRLPDLPDSSFSYKGEMTLPEVSSAEGKGEAWLSGSKVRMKKKISSDHKELAEKGLEAFRKQVVEQIHHFMADFSKAA